jgi:hypothetical protein
MCTSEPQTVLVVTPTSASVSVASWPAVAADQNDGSVQARSPVRTLLGVQRLKSTESTSWCLRQSVATAPSPLPVRWGAARGPIDRSTRATYMQQFLTVVANLS